MDFTSITSKLILNLYIVFHIIRKLIIYNNLIHNKISKFLEKIIYIASKRFHSCIKERSSLGAKQLQLVSLCVLKPYSPHHVRGVAA